MGFLGSFSERLGDIAMGSRNPCAKEACFGCCGDNFFPGLKKLELSVLTARAPQVVEVTREELRVRQEALRERVARGEPATETTVYVARDEENPKAALRRAALIDGPCPNLTPNGSPGVFECAAGEGRPRQCKGFIFDSRDCKNVRQVKDRGKVYLGAMIGKRPGL